MTDTQQPIRISSAPEPTTDADGNQVFSIGLVLAGGGSAGAYIAGVVDFLLEALTEWEGARAGGLPLEQSHRVQLSVVTGTSAGAMTAAMMTRAVCGDYEPARGLENKEEPGPPREKNRLYDCWVRRIDARKLLGTADFEGKGNSFRLLSLLDSSGLDAIGDIALSVPPTGMLPPFLGDGMLVHLTVTSLRGLPYAMDFTSENNVQFGTLGHGDHVSFKLTSRIGAGYQALDPDAPLAPATSADQPCLDKGWQRLRATALASGAFPIGLSARLLDRDIGELASRQPAPWLPPQPKQRRFVCVDGGVIDNEPVSLARASMRDAGLTQEGSETRGALLLVDPFPSLLPPDPDEADPAALGWRMVAMRLIGAVLTQLRFRPEEIRAARSKDHSDQFLISPVYSDGGFHRSDAIAGGMLASFGAFLSEDYRRHDFQLGRRNCQQFLRSHFLLPDDNPVFGGKAGPGTGRLPIIPLLGSANSEIPLPARNVSAMDLDDLGARMWNRLRLVGDALIEDDVRPYLGGWFGRAAARLYYRVFVVPRIVRTAKQVIGKAAADFRGKPGEEAPPNVKEGWPLLGIALAATSVLMAALFFTGLFLDKPAAPRGMLSLQLAETGAQANAILIDWQNAGVAGWARANLYLDWAFVPAYGAFLLLLGRELAQGFRDARHGVLAVIALLAGAAGVGAAGFDLVENSALSAMLRHAATDALAAQATSAAQVKFGLVGGSLVALTGLTALLVFVKARIKPDLSR